MNKSCPRYGSLIIRHDRKIARTWKSAIVHTWRAVRNLPFRLRVTAILLYVTASTGLGFPDVRVTWLVHLCSMTHSHKWRASEARHIHVTVSHVWHVLYLNASCNCPNDTVSLLLKKWRMTSQLCVYAIACVSVTGCAYHWLIWCWQKESLLCGGVLTLRRALPNASSWVLLLCRSNCRRADQIRTIELVGLQRQINCGGKGK